MRKMLETFFPLHERIDSPNYTLCSAKNAKRKHLELRRGRKRKVYGFELSWWKKERWHRRVQNPLAGSGREGRRALASTPDLSSRYESFCTCANEWATGSHSSLHPPRRCLNPPEPDFHARHVSGKSRVESSRNSARFPNSQF